jgi:hypothetical protein
MPCLHRVIDGILDCRPKLLLALQRLPVEPVLPEGAANTGPLVVEAGKAALDHLHHRACREMSRERDNEVKVIGHDDICEQLEPLLGLDLCHRNRGLAPPWAGVKPAAYIFSKEGGRFYNKSNLAGQI